jgi:hypothetical protein
VILRAADGRVLWDWAADKRFAYAVHEISVEGERSWSVAIPWPAAGTGDQLIVEAGLTTDEAAPRFGAAIPVTTPLTGAVRFGERQ